jgi:glyceraldehyde 3-phosphate dehydrogenase
LLFGDQFEKTVLFHKRQQNSYFYSLGLNFFLFRNQLIDRSVSDILNLHKYANDFVGKPISIFDSVEIVLAIKSLNLPPSKLDIGTLTFEYLLQKKNMTVLYHLLKIN